VGSHIDNVDTTADHIDNVDTYAKTYQGPHDSDPDKRNNGDALQKGDLYFNTSNGNMRVYVDDTSKWKDSYTDVPDNFVEPTTGSDTLLKEKIDLDVDKDFTIGSDEYVTCFGLTVDDDKTLTVDGYLVDNDFRK